MNVKFYIGPQVGIYEFDDVDIGISWYENVPVFKANMIILGTEKVVHVFFEDVEEIVEDSAILDYRGVAFAVGTSNDVIYPEFFHYAKSNRAKFVVIYEKVEDPSWFMYSKHRAWVHSQESGLYVFSVVDFNGNIKYGVYSPYEFSDKNPGIIIEGGAPHILEVEL